MLKNTQQRSSLPSVEKKSRQKNYLSSVEEKNTRQRNNLSCVEKNTRQRISLSSFEKKNTQKRNVDTRQR